MGTVSKDVFQAMFNPKSVAVFGASSNEVKSGSRYLNALIQSRYPGRIYPINPGEKEILGLKAYASIRDCPEPVDYAIFCVPARFVLDLVEDCGANGLKVMQLFTAGFRETGQSEGIALEQRLVQAARGYGIRVIGPNCIGVYCPENRIPYGLALSPMEPGNIGFLSQSGGNAGRLIFGGFLQGMRFSKVISYGNGCDLNAVDFLEYFGSDSKTEVIGAYIEGISWGRPFLELVKEISGRKPIVLWKGGQTPGGKRTLTSHTGSIAGSYRLWEDALKQCGGVVVRDFEELSDTLLAFSAFPYLRGNRVVITAGLMGGGGGISVEGTDLSIQEGLELVDFPKDLQEEVASLLPNRAGTILTNPIDFGSAMSLGVLKRVVETVLRETECDVILIQEFFDRMLGLASEDALLSFFAELSRLGEKSERPIIIVWPPEAANHEGFLLRLKLIERGVIVYPSIRRAARAISNVSSYRARFGPARNPG